MVAAWIRALTGVGPSIASGSHTWSGNCALLPTAPQKISSAIPAICQYWIWPPMYSAGSFWKTSGKLSVPTVVQMAMIPSENPRSPTRLTMKAFFAARAADRRRYQKPISR